MDDPRAQLHGMGEVVSDERHEGIILRSISNDYDFVRHTSFRQRTPGWRRSSPQCGTCSSMTFLACLQSLLGAAVWPCRRRTATSAVSSALTVATTATVAAHALNLYDGDRWSSNRSRGRRSSTGRREETETPSGALYTRQGDEHCLKQATKREQVSSINFANIGSA